jgi:tripartite-type tricarboxylate transporter receptor subunit TctC
MHSSFLPGRLTRRRAVLLGGAVGLAAGLSTGLARAQVSDYPSRPVRLVVPFGPGTSTDTVARVVAEGMARQLGQPVVVENKAGGGGSIGSEAVARAPADGYTIVMGTVGTHAINVALYRKLPYDPLRDFAPLALVGQTPTLLVVSASSPWRSLKDLAAAAAKAPGVSFASAGNGTSGHLAGELLRSRLGGTMVHVPYKEGGLALSDVMSGQVQFMFYHPAAVLPQIKAGKLRALGVSGAQRSAAAPEVAPIQEQVGGAFDLIAWFMLYAPASTPAPVLARLRAAAEASLANPEVAGKLTGQGVEKGVPGPDGLAGFASREVAKWSDLVRLSGAQID